MIFGEPGVKEFVALRRMLPRKSSIADRGRGTLSDRRALASPEARMNWLNLTSTEGHPILVNMDNVVSVIPYRDEDGTHAKLFSLAPSSGGDVTYTQSIVVAENLTEIAGRLAAR
jgi:hypothetical protein